MIPHDVKALKSDYGYCGSHRFKQPWIQKIFKIFRKRREPPVMPDSDLRGKAALQMYHLPAVASRYRLHTEMPLALFRGN